MRDDAWFSGFADGEGCFFIRAGNGSCYPEFSVKLRLDDLACLEALQRAFGGRVRLARQREREDRPGNKSQALWAVVAKQDLKGLVAYFDHFPLRAKKANDYAIWRLAVIAYIRSGRSASDLPALRQALMDGRAYARGGLVSVPPPDPQLIFGGLRAAGKAPV